MNEDALSKKKCNFAKHNTGVMNMEFMDMLKEWLQIRDMEKDHELVRLLESKQRDWLRMNELEDAINRKIRGEL